MAVCCVRTLYVQKLSCWRWSLEDDAHSRSRSTNAGMEILMVTSVGANVKQKICPAAWVKSIIKGSNKKRWERHFERRIEATTSKMRVCLGSPLLLLVWARKKQWSCVIWSRRKSPSIAQGECCKFQHRWNASDRARTVIWSRKESVTSISMDRIHLIMPGQSSDRGGKVFHLWASD